MSSQHKDVGLQSRQKGFVKARIPTTGWKQHKNAEKTRGALGARQASRGPCVSLNSLHHSSDQALSLVF